MRGAKKVTVAATAFGAILAGSTIDRLIVQIPALQEMGPVQWAEFSRRADLSKRGLAFYPFIGVGHAALSIASAIAEPRNRAAKVAAALAIGGMITTAKAAPIMLGVRKLGDDEAALEQAMHGFVFWSAIRAVCQVGAFAANVTALIR